MCYNYWVYSLCLKCEYLNPFCSIPKEYLPRLIDEFYDINYDNVEFKFFQEGDTIRYATYHNYPVAKIDGWLEVHYIHDNNLDKLKTKYYRRLERMKRCIEHKYDLQFLFFVGHIPDDKSCYFETEEDFAILEKLLEHDNVVCYTKLQNVANRFKRPNMVYVPNDAHEQTFVLNDYKLRLDI